MVSLIVNLPLRPCVANTSSSILWYFLIIFLCSSMWWSWNTTTKISNLIPENTPGSYYLVLRMSSVNQCLHKCGKKWSSIIFRILNIVINSLETVLCVFKQKYINYLRYSIKCYSLVLQWNSIPTFSLFVCIKASTAFLSFSTSESANK